MSDEVLDGIARMKLLPVVVIDDPDDAVPLFIALRNAGLPVAEVSFRTPAARDALRAIHDAGLTEGPDAFLLGAGTVTTVEQVDLALAAGAQFIASPGFSPRIVQYCQDREIAVIPGAVTATEIQACLEQGLNTVKFFPAATSGGPAAIRALGNSFPEVHVIPAGGIDLSTIEHYLGMPNVSAIGGTWMVPRAAIQTRKFSTIWSLTEEAVSAVQNLSLKETGESRW